MDIPRGWELGETRGTGTARGRDLELFDRWVEELEVAASIFASHAVREGSVRGEYCRLTEAFVADLRADVRLGRLSPKEAARQAQEMRNFLMEMARGKSSALGRALARYFKENGKTLAELEQKYADDLFKAPFERLIPDQRVQVWAKILSKAAQPNASWTTFARWLGYSGRGLWALTLLLAFVEIAHAENRWEAAGQQLALVSGGVLGSTLGAAGVICGPATVYCVSGLMILGGAAGALAADRLYRRLQGN